MSDKTEAAEIADLALMGADANSISSEARRAFMVIPADARIADLEHLQDAPNRIKAKPVFRHVSSLAAYTKRFGDEASVAFSDWRKGEIAVHLDYHSDALVPSHDDHRATFKAQRSASWEGWRKANDKPMRQAEFGRFLEERAHEIVEPDAADVVEVCMNLDAIKKVSFKSSTRLSDGYRQISYTEEGDMKGALRVPETLTILVPIYEGEEPERVKVRLRTRVEDASLHLFVTFDNLDLIEERAFQRTADRLAHELPDLPIYQAILG